MIASLLMAAIEAKLVMAYTRRCVLYRAGYFTLFYLWVFDDWAWWLRGAILASVVYAYLSSTYG
jgi:hypothetical protein